MSSTAQPYTFSQRAQKITSSTIREILKVTERPEIISFAGGLPAPQGFPVDTINAAYDRVLRENGRSALQYGPTEGYAPLRAWVANDLKRVGAAHVSPDEVLIVSGSQQALDMLGKLFIDPGSKVLVESPSYLGALQSFSLFEPRYQSVATDAGGLVPEALTDECVRDARFIYALPNFQNPTGTTLNLERRKALVARCAQAGVPIIEDDPYGDLRYAGQALPGLLGLGRAAGATVIRLGSFSKVLAPGLRLGYIVAPQPIIAKLVQIKQATDLHTATLTQMAVYEAVNGGFLETHLPTVRELYKQQCGYMLKAMEEFFPATTAWTHPEGGMFLWVTLPEHIDASELLARAIQQNVAFVPGEPFYAGDDRRINTLRLSFVTVPEDKIRQGIAILGRLINESVVGLNSKAA
ncbi:aminotransferase-like domain-containing protein [Eoetvoesiella caeni]|uniref:2-aminoadipate transaminase n=1 Tax=Eoetvoesiella caeni TaxID=645616 RepID=A0A366HGK8_9BURK|nr:PLP-dependent aminotransferase family protein [Eoetvoesiella caeni]MCI2807858.1 PLP-dependent aminotransferase family protein [Eoetvoesiella caeni]NYT54140.1 PLP-dependent aminotransferase family protein [Eoetvoesiella caeni]RBP41774.1 2-aminoadipate transaminase [Eoetvoesiella caeni]